jgi:hypothetical protein
VQQIEVTRAEVGRALAPVSTPLPATVASTRTKSSALVALKNKGSVRSFVLDRLRPAAGCKIEMKFLLQEYRSWCEQKGFEAKDVSDFAEDMRAVCDKADIKIQTLGNRVFCLDVQLADTPSSP